MAIADLLRRRPEDVGRVVRELGPSEFLKYRRLGLAKEKYWPEHDRALDNLYEFLVEDLHHLIPIPDIEKNLDKIYPATHALHQVLDLAGYLPIRPRKENDKKRGVAGIGRSWKVYLFDGKNILRPEDLILIDSGKSFGKGLYKAEIIGKGNFNPYGEKNWAKEGLLELDIMDVIKKFGRKDEYGQEVKVGQIGYHTCKVRRKPPEKVTLPEKPG